MKNLIIKFTIAVLLTALFSSVVMPYPLGIFCVAIGALIYEYVKGNGLVGKEACAYGIGIIIGAILAVFVGVENWGF